MPLDFRKGRSTSMCAELVEGLFFPRFELTEGPGFDRLSPNGIEAGDGKG
jgi:hypothetical protein